MARTRIEDLPKDMKISKEDMKKVVGGALITGIERDLRLSVAPLIPDLNLPQSVLDMLNKSTLELPGQNPNGSNDPQGG